MKMTLLKISIVALIATFAIVSCKKKSDNATPEDTTEQTNGGDDSRVQYETDQVIDEANTTLSSNSSTLRTSVTASICGATIDSSSKSTGKLIINYDGTACNGRKRSGSITLQLSGSAKWTDAGASVSITFNDYAVTRVYDGKTLTFSGTKYIKNVNGGLTATLAVGSGSVVHKIQSTNLQVKFDDGTTRTWGVSRTRTITRQSSGYTISTVGDSTVSGVSGVAAAGTTRLNSPFYSVITSPIVWNTAVCSYAPVSGVRTLKGVSRELTITYGVDENGNAVSGSCPYGSKIVWTSATGVTRTAIVIY